MKQLIIQQGLPGGGKSSWAEGMKKGYEREGLRVVICSADQFYEKDCPCQFHPSFTPMFKCHQCKNTRKLFEFIPGKSGEAHGACFRKAIDACMGTNRHTPRRDDGEDPADIVIIDNTNTTVTEVAPYILLAQSYGYEVKINRYSIPTLESFRRNIHGVPMDTILWMNGNLERFDDEAPSYWPKVVVM